MKISSICILVLSFVIAGLLSGLCMAATQSGENAKAIAGKTLDAGILENKPSASVGESPSTGSQVPIEKVPIEIVRRATNHLEEWRSEEPSWGEKAYIGSSVNLFFRPDMQGPSDYEFTVYPMGFIMASNNPNEGLISQTSATSKPRSVLLNEEAKRLGKTAVKKWKLDSLSYAAEDANGELISTIGEMPMMIIGMDSGLLKEDAQGGDVNLKPLEGEGNDDNLKIANRTPERTGSQSSPIKFQKWPSWTALKEGYAGNYKVFLEAERIASAEEWAIQKQLDELGEGLFPGDEYVLAFIYQDATFDISGPGKDYINSKVLDRTGMPDALQINVLNKAPPEGKAEFWISISYKNGQREKIKFAVLDPTKVKRQGEDETNPKVIGTILSTPEEQKLRVQTHWGPWTAYWAGDEEDQRIYCQWDEGGCAIGCGPVAWAMLFCWADHQSWIGADDWNHGGAYSGDAPRYMNDQVRDMIREIHDIVDTTCIGDSGATLPSNMKDAWLYLDGRTTMGYHAESGPIGSLDCRNCARNSIRDRDTPAVIGTGFYEHYPLAWGYRFRESHWGPATDRDFYVNQGWCGAGDSWIDARTWFCGYVYT